MTTIVPQQSQTPIIQPHRARVCTDANKLCGCQRHCSAMRAMAANGGEHNDVLIRWMDDREI
jgi:hypothetical protein